MVKITANPYLANVRSGDDAEMSGWSSGRPADLRKQPKYTGTLTFAGDLLVTDSPPLPRATSGRS